MEKYRRPRRGAFGDAAVAVDLWFETAREQGREHLRDSLAGKGVAREQMA